MRLLCLFIVFWSGAIVAADDWQLRGRVVDEAGRPVAGATVDHQWRANGTQKRADGTPLDLSNDEDVQTLWGKVGQMEPFDGATTTADGSFELQVRARRHTFMAMDRARQRGGLAVIREGEEAKPVLIRLVPLVKIHGTLELAESGKKPVFTIVRFLVPEEASRPLDNFSIAQCGSLKSRFEVLLPPGKYLLEALGAPEGGDFADHTITPNPEITVNGDRREQDLGRLRLAKPTPTFRQEQMAKADVDGSWGDYKKRYGQTPPEWHVFDARRVKKETQPGDFRGKWLLVYFWGLSCPHCLGEDLPRLAKFYEAHAAQRDQFEILAFCTDCDHDLKSIVELDKALAPIIKHVWSGNHLPFPVLLDPTFTTMRRYGLHAYGTLLLIDPNGKLMEGDEKTLAERLKR